ncbi:uncharacterized protein COLE_04541 [Cutaneotrichosporon oleaginosum]|uniref:uncharacterized protein n=1 Tax=Cutaneotrichosporon oleaginosum TaxID=879819 RepID=UPI0013220281|nr:hypothetical protein COLE_04541 [Cutaneotrichosporon oleaginosum]
MMRLFRKKPASAEPQRELTEEELKRLQRRRKLGNTATWVIGSAMFSDGYANAVVSPVKTILTRLYPDWLEADKSENGTIFGAVGFAGMVVGMLMFGLISDKLGRKPGMFITTAIIFVFMILMACAAGPNPQVLMNCLIAFRFFVGIGIGGEYPCGSTAAAEATENEGVSKKRQQRLFVWATHFIIDVGFPVAWFVPLVLLWIFGMDHLRAVWRGSLLLGAVPPLLLTFFRLFMDEPEAYQKNAMKHVKIPYRLILKRYWPKLLAVSFCWFLYDWITYPFGMYAGDITSAATGPNPTLYQTLGWGCLVNFFYVPGAFVGAWMSDWLGPKYCMVFGSVMQAAFGFGLSGGYEYFKKRVVGFAIVYGIFLSWGEIGPGNNLGLFAAKAAGPTAARAQLYSIAAASGKVGAFVGTYIFPHIVAQFAKRSKLLEQTGIFYVGSGVALLSATVTFFFLPNIKPDNMIDEDRLFREYLIENGVDVSGMGMFADKDAEKAQDETKDKPEFDKVNVVERE